ncbi:MAG TPA: multicopper oxidase domain-containing protein [Ramlibacter sp.]|nr:multicopper oxidase domain-containing protein [Ramlibacter sp.]
MSSFLPDGSAGPSRRFVFKLGAASGVAAAAYGLLSPKSGNAKDGDQVGRSPFTTPFAVPLPLPAVKQPVAALDPPPQKEAGPGEAGRLPHQRWEEFLPKTLYEVHAREALHSFHPELPTQLIWGFDGLLPGPTFVNRIGNPVLVRMYNDLPANHIGFGSPEISTHLHGGHIAAESDGYAGDFYSPTKFGPTLTRAGAYYDYHYPNILAGYDDSPATFGDPREMKGTLWYHDHRMDFTAANVYKGLAGFHLLFDAIDSGNENDPNPAALRLPSGVGQFDIPLMLQDKKFDSSGMLFFDQFDPEGFVGEKMLVNGKIQPFFKVARRKYRFRMCNGSATRFFQVYLTFQGRDQEFAYIANDGDLLEAPLTAQHVRLGMAERGDIVVDFSRYPIGAQLFLVDRIVQDDPRGPDDKLQNPGTPMLRIDVDREPPAPDNSQVPAKLRALAPVDLVSVVRTRRFELERGNGQWQINGRFFDPERIDADPGRGRPEIWVLKNGGGGWWHPLHIHLEDQRILSRDGRPPPPHERGRKDVTVVGPDEEVRVFIVFRDFTGKYVAHCHNTVHEDHAMMIRWDVVP